VKRIGGSLEQIGRHGELRFARAWRYTARRAKKIGVAFVMVDENAKRVEEWSEPCQKIDMWGDLSSRR
jgi:hypothetical protein